MLARTMLSQPILEQQLERAIGATRFTDLGALHRGKVRDTYRVDGLLVLVTTDRISAFDRILEQRIPFKGQVLNQTAAFFFEHTRDIAPNHLVAMPDPNVAIAVECQPVPVEFVVRGYLAGHAWRQYRSGLRSVSGVALPDGLRESSRLPTPVLTPTTKEEHGHDEDISREGILARGILTPSAFGQLEDLSLALFERGTAMSAERGLLLVDTKYEFGRAPDGSFMLIDEVHTPDSSRYYHADGYEERQEAGVHQRQISKEFVREWLMSYGFQGEADRQPPDLPDSLCLEVASRYVALYETVTGRAFQPEMHPDPVARIRGAIETYLSTRGH